MLSWIWQILRDQNEKRFSLQIVFLFTWEPFEPKSQRLFTKHRAFKGGYGFMVNNKSCDKKVYFVDSIFAMSVLMHSKLLPVLAKYPVFNTNFIFICVLCLHSYAILYGKGKVHFFQNLHSFHSVKVAVTRSCQCYEVQINYWL